jgi:hypothetical protein
VKFFYDGELDHPVCKAVTYRQRSNKSGISKRNRWRSRHESQRSLGIFSQSTTHCCDSNGSFSSSWDFTGSRTPYGVQWFESTTLHPTFDIQVQITVYAMTAVVRIYNVSCWFTVLHLPRSCLLWSCVHHHSAFESSDDWQVCSKNQCIFYDFPALVGESDFRTCYTFRVEITMERERKG